MKQKSMGFGCLLAAGLFLWNPIVGVTDLLPDAVGYLLLCLGLLRLADLNERLSDAQRGFRAALWVSLGRVVAWLLSDVLLAGEGETLNRYEQPVWVLLFAFVLAVLELYFLLPAWKSFFAGLSDLAEFHGGSGILQAKKQKTLVERLAGATARLVILRSVLTVLPEATVLTSFEKDAENPLFPFDWFSYAGLFRTLAALAVGVVGVLWLIGYLRLMLAALRDRAWHDELNSLYAAEILPDVGRLLGRRISASFGFFRVGIFFFIDLSMLYHGVLPDWFSVLIFLAGWLMLSLPLDRRAKCFFLCGAALTVVGILRTVLNIRYLKEFIPKDALHLPRAYDGYLGVQLCGIVESLLMPVFVLLLMGAILQMVAEALQEPNSRRWLRLKKRAIPAVILLVLGTAVKIAEICLQHIYGWIWLPQFAVSLIAVMFFFNFLTEAAETVSEQIPPKRRV